LEAKYWIRTEHIQLTRKNEHQIHYDLAFTDLETKNSARLFGI